MWHSRKFPKYLKIDIFFIGWWRHDDVTCQILFYIINISEMFYYHVIIVTSSLVTLITGHCVPWLHVKQTRNGVDNCPWIGLFPSTTTATHICSIVWRFVKHFNQCKNTPAMQWKWFESAYAISISRHSIIDCMGEE